ncbi:reverse transcriptase domain-containing protein [Tanacetum coccineum]|uniref:Reverse transcriptase domain-containing protein n=1 Tax=Tanacetum coccineum TaxID=301880 RepID=A0ABQ5AC12_9ASTR
MGQLHMTVMVANKEHTTTAWMNFMGDQITIAMTMALLETRDHSDTLGIIEKSIQTVLQPSYVSTRALEAWRMCVDFTDLNKACPQDCYPLPEIDWKVESLCGYPFKCFLDAYKGYHQIQMAKDDEEKTAFHTSQVGRNLEVYVDDLVIKSHTEDELVRDIVETFRALRKINMKLNPKKCTFGATEGMFLGYLIEPDGIKPCPEKTKAVIQLPSPRTMKKSIFKMGRYFQAHPIAVITDQPIKQVISKPDASGRLQKWSVLLGEHNISYRPRTAVKGQILADFLIEKPETDAVLPQSEVKLQDPWILFTDGSSCVDGSGAGLILTNPEGMEFTYALRFEFSATNNEAEYEALIAD